MATYSLKELFPEYTGWADYNDNTTGTTPISVSASTWTALTNDGAGTYTDETNLGDSVTTLWDSINNKLFLEELPVGQLVTFRLDVEVTTTTANQEVDLRLAVYDSTPTLIFSQNFDSHIVKSVGTKRLVVTHMFYIGSGFRSGATHYDPKLELYSDAACTVHVHGLMVSVS